MPRTTLPERLTACPRCGGDLNYHQDHASITCSDCDRWAAARVADPEAALEQFDFAEIVEHSRPHPEECLCAACRYAREQGAEGYI